MQPRQRVMALFLMVTTIASSMGLMAYMTLITNFNVEIGGMTAFQVGLIQSIREVPGFLAILSIYLLLILSEHRAAALAIILLGVGLGLTGFFPGFAGVAITTFLLSTGFHLFETLNQSLSLQYFSLSEAPLLLGRLRAGAAAANIAVGLVLVILAERVDYQWLFAMFGLAVAGMGVWAVCQDPSDESLPIQRKKMVLRAKYWLYYALTFLAGSRRQILMVFVPFLLVSKFEFSLLTISVLFLINSAVSWFLNPVIGRMINRFGERSLMFIEYSVVIVVCFLYATTDSTWLAGVIYVLDQIFFNLAVSLRTYLQKIADPVDIAPSSAVGFTINHIAAVFIPAAGGALWLWDARVPFYAGCVLGLCSLLLAFFVRVPVAASAKS